LENDLVIFVVKPEEVSFFGFAIFGHPHSHSRLCSLFESMLLSLDELVIV